MKTVMQNVDIRAMNVRKVYICYNNLSYYCQLNVEDIPLIESGKFVKSRFECENIALSNKSIEESKLLFYGRDDYYGEVYIKEDETIPCIIEISAKKRKIEQIINEIKQNSNFLLHLSGKMNNKKINQQKMTFRHVYIGFDNSRYELIFDKNRLTYKEENNEVVLNFIILDAVYIPRKHIHTKALTTFQNEELSQIVIKKCPIE